jgi:hypothetical protein
MTDQDQDRLIEYIRTGEMPERSEEGGVLVPPDLAKVMLSLFAWNEFKQWRTEYMDWLLSNGRKPEAVFLSRFTNEEGTI